MFQKFISWLHAILTIALALFFICKGIEKFGPLKLRDKHVVEANAQDIVQKIIVEKNYDPPYGYDITMNTFRYSGFIKVIGFFQILAGLLMLFTKTRLAGLLTLFPIILNIFLMHFFFDNRPHENVETGRLLAITLLLLSFYWKKLWQILWLKKSA